MKVKKLISGTAGIVAGSYTHLDVYKRQEQPMESYYVYGPDGEVTILSTAGEAISLAYEISGTVTGASGAYVWRKDKICLLYTSRCV